MDIVGKLLNSSSKPSKFSSSIFDKKEIAGGIIRALADKKGMEISADTFVDYREYKDREYDKMAATLRQHMDMEAVYGMLREASIR